MGAIIQGVKVENVDEDEKLHYKARALEIKVKDKDETLKLETPTRFSNQQEINAKAWIPSEVPIKSYAGVVDLRLNEKEINGLLNDNITASRRLSNLKKAANKFLHFPIRAVLIQPTLSGKSGFKYLNKNPQLKERFLRLSMQFAKEAGFNTYVIPYLDSDIEKTKALYKELIGKEGETLEITPAIDMGMRPKNLEPLLKYIKDTYILTGLTNNVTLIYKSYAQVPVSYDIAWSQFRDTNTMITLVGAQRYISDVGGISSLHLGSFVLGDAFSLKVNRPFFSQDKEGRGEKRVKNLRFFDHKTLKLNQLLTAKNDTTKLTNLLEEMTSVYGNDTDYIKQAINNLEEAKTDDKKYGSISAITKVHEFVESKLEFSTESEFIKKTEAKDYIKSKLDLETAISKVSKKTL